MENPALIPDTIAPEQEENITRANVDVNCQEIETSEGSNTHETWNKLLYTVTEVPPWYLTIILAFQHILTMMGSTIAYPFVLAPALCMSEDDPARGELLCSILFASGIITFLQTTFGVRLPIVQGGSYAFVIPVLAILALPEWQCPKDIDKMDKKSRDQLWMDRTVVMQGSLAVASVVQLIIGAFGMVGAILRFMTPLTVAPVITMVGLTFFPKASSMMAENWPVSLTTLVLVTLSSQYLPNVGIPLPYPRERPRSRFYIFKFFPVLLSILTMWLVCALLTISGVLPTDSLIRTDRATSLIQQSPWFRVPYPGQWGLPVVSISAVVGLWSGTIAATVESVGDYFACARLAGAPAPPVHAINRGILVEGFGCILAGVWGCIIGTTSYGENIGAIGITKVGSRRVVQVAGVLMVILGTFNKLGAVFATIPEPIIGGMFCASFGVITTVGISNLQYVDLNSSRNMYVFGVSIMLGLVVPQWIAGNPDAVKTGYETLDQILIILMSTGMLISGIAGFFLDNTIPGTAKERGALYLSESNEETKRNCAETESYNLPFGMDYINSHTWTQFVPLFPGYRGWRHCFKNLKCKVTEDDTGL